MVGRMIEMRQRVALINVMNSSETMVANAVFNPSLNTTSQENSAV